MELFADSAKNNTAQIAMIASCLASNFLNPLYESCIEKNYFVYIGCVSQILDWTCEFYCQYHQKFPDWENFEQRSNNTSDTGSCDDLLIAWGNDRIKQFLSQHAKETATPLDAPVKTAHLETVNSIATTNQ